MLLGGSIVVIGLIGAGSIIVFISAFILHTNHTSAPNPAPSRDPASANPLPNNSMDGLPPGCVSWKQVTHEYIASHFSDMPFYCVYGIVVARSADFHDTPFPMEFKIYFSMLPSPFTVNVPENLRTFYFGVHQNDCIYAVGRINIEVTNTEMQAVSMNYCPE